MNPDDGFVNVDPKSDDVSALSQTSFAKFARYEAFLASDLGTGFQDLEVFGIMEDEDCDGINLEEFNFFCLVKPSPCMLPFCSRGERGREDM